MITSTESSLQITLNVKKNVIIPPHDNINVTIKEDENNYVSSSEVSKPNVNENVTIQPDDKPNV
jgi:hypothetical protein